MATASARREEKRVQANARDLLTEDANRRKNRKPNYLERTAGVARLTNAQAARLKNPPTPKKPVSRVVKQVEKKEVKIGRTHKWVSPEEKNKKKIKIGASRNYGS